MTFTTVLIANRGEIAVRVCRAARDAGLRSVAVYADGDADAPHVRAADEAYALGGTSPGDTYLNIEKLLEIAGRAGADAVHPGYGFLSESAQFARAVNAAGLTWIGPDPETIELLGDKGRARTLAESVGAPLAPGTSDPVAGAEEVAAFAEKSGLPIVIKAVHGGGGRGIRVVHERGAITEAYESAVREAVTAFGQGDCLVEKFLERPRHIEAQVLGDKHGRIAVLGTRDCSLQRRNQKLVEEAPAPFLSDEVRNLIHQSAADICGAANYVGAGTVEFLLGSDGTLSFLEVNTRLQVEHPITEMVTGVDLVREQFRIADGEPMTVPQEPVAFGHAFEFRINAEDPALGFLPTPGRIEKLTAPEGPGVRFDSGIAEGFTIPGDFDSLLAKLVVWGRDRQEALGRARRALAEFTIDGVATVLPFHRFVASDPAFTAGDAENFAVHTRWIEEECSADFAPSPAVAAPGESLMRRLPIEIDGKRTELGITDAMLSLFGGLGGSSAHPSADPSADATDAAAAAEESGAEIGALVAPFAGNLSGWKADEGDTVAAGDTVAIVEAMKMEVPVQADRSGVLRRYVEAGQAVTAQQSLGVIE